MRVKHIYLDPLRKMQLPLSTKRILPRQLPVNDTYTDHATNGAVGRGLYTKRFFFFCLVKNA